MSALPDGEGSDNCCEIPLSEVIQPGRGPVGFIRKLAFL